MSSYKKKKPSGCGCLNIPISVIVLFFGGVIWLFTQRDNLGLSKIILNSEQLVLIFVIIILIGLNDISQQIIKNGKLIEYLFKPIMKKVFKKN